MIVHVIAVVENYHLTRNRGKYRFNTGHSEQQCTKPNSSFDTFMMFESVIALPHLLTKKEERSFVSRNSSPGQYLGKLGSTLLIDMLKLEEGLGLPITVTC